jgi:hypothetical protein
MFGTVARILHFLYVCCTKQNFIKSGTKNNSNVGKSKQKNRFKEHVGATIISGNTVTPFQIQVS